VKQNVTPSIRFSEIFAGLVCRCLFKTAHFREFPIWRDGSPEIGMQGWERETRVTFSECKMGLSHLQNGVPQVARSELKHTFTEGSTDEKHDYPVLAGTRQAVQFLHLVWVDL